MKNIAAVLALILWFCAPAFGQVERVSGASRIVHYVKTHKALLLSDAVIIAAQAADAASSVHCQKIRPVPCIDSSPTLGKHPTELATWGQDMGLAAFIVTADHGAVWLSNSDPEHYGAYRHFIWLPTIGIAGIEGPTVWNNVCVAEHDQKARQAIARERLSR